MPARSIIKLSSCVNAFERVALMGLIAAIAILVLSNVIFRAFGTTIAWADEIAVYAMIISAFFGASLMLRARIDPAVFLVHELVSPRVIRILKTIISVTCIIFGGTLFHTCYQWFSPLTLIEADFDVETFQGISFNFIYTDVTPVMGLPAYWFYLVMPWFSLAITLHATANLMEDIGAVERVENPAKIDATEI